MKWLTTSGCLLITWQTIISVHTQSSRKYAHLCCSLSVGYTQVVSTKLEQSAIVVCILCQLQVGMCANSVISYRQLTKTVTQSTTHQGTKSLLLPVTEGSVFKIQMILIEFCSQLCVHKSMFQPSSL